MSLAQVFAQSPSEQLAWRFGPSAPQNLSLMLEDQARSLRDASSLLLMYPEPRANGSKVLTIDFRALVIEQNAWVNFLCNRGVQKGDTVVVWLPYGPSFVSVCYALFKIGAHVVALDPEFVWKTGYATLRKQAPQHLIGTRLALSFAKSMAPSARGPINRIEVDDPQTLIGSALRSFQARSTFWGQDEVQLTVMRTSGQRCSIASFDQTQLCQLATIYKEWFTLKERDRCVPGSILEALLFPAAGLTSLIADERLSNGSAPTARLIAQAIERFGLQLISGDARFWRAMAQLSEQGELPLAADFHAVAQGAERHDHALEAVSAAMPKVKFSIVFGSACNPFVCFRRRGDEPKGAESYRSAYAGRPLPGLQVSLLPTKVLRWPEVPMAATPIGEIATARHDYAPLGDEDCWTGTGELGFFDPSGGLWHCGSKEDVVASSFGGFCPARCEALFNSHPRVKRAILIPLRKHGKTRPGLVIETELGAIPKRGVEESRFKAELLQIGADVEETSLIIDIFFSDRLPLEDGSIEAVDRIRLAKDYSRWLRF